MRHWLRVAVALVLVAALSSCAAPGPAMPYVVGKQLDVAKSDIKHAGFVGEVGVIGGDLLGVLFPSEWVVCGQVPDAGETMAEPPRLTVARSCDGQPSGPVMPEVVGARLDRARSDITRAGYDGKIEILGGGLGGVLVESNWTVCEQLPPAGQVVQQLPRLVVDRKCGDAAG